MVLAIDQMPERLETSKKIGAVPVDMSKEDPIEVVKSHTEGRGAGVVLEAVGVEASLKSCFRYVRPAGTISAVGMYTEMEFPSRCSCRSCGTSPSRSAWPRSGATMGQMLKLIEAGKADPSKIITHTMSLDESPHGHDIFTNRKDNCIKVLLSPTVSGCYCCCAMICACNVPWSWTDTKPPRLGGVTPKSENLKSSVASALMTLAWRVIFSSQVTSF